MKSQSTNKFIAYMALLSGLTLSAVAEYYSILGLTAIFSAAVIPIIIMGVALGVGKITATIWLKQNWDISPYSVRIYLFSSVIILMLITAMGTFGFLSKAHSDQTLVSGDVAAKIAVYDEKIKTAKENIDVNRKALKQMDEAVDQVMGRSSSETGADKAVSIRKGQAKERSRLLSEIQAEQSTISKLNEERAPIAAEVRKVEAEVGPIKYIAAFVYGSADPTILEKAVTWVIIIIIVVFDPLAVFLLLASQISFQRIREEESKITADDIMNDPGLKQFFDNGKEVARRLDAGESLEGLPNVTLTNAEVAKASLEAVFKDRPEYFAPKPKRGRPKKKPADLKEVVETLTPTEVETLVNELREVKPELFNTATKTYDWESLPEGTDYVTIDGQKMSVRAGKALYPQTPK